MNVLLFHRSLSYLSFSTIVLSNVTLYYLILSFSTLICTLIRTPGMVVGTWSAIAFVDVTDFDSISIFSLAQQKLWAKGGRNIIVHFILSTLLLFSFLLFFFSTLLLFYSSFLLFYFSTIYCCLLC